MEVISDRSSRNLKNLTGSWPEFNPYVTELAKLKAIFCSFVRTPTLFQDWSGKPYLETHHIEWLSLGGEDTIENTVALCPNCHRKMYILNHEADKSRLKETGRRES
jgi:5-methylcytosine-specific restriction protein A